MDNFALLGQARQPWIDLDLLKTSFLAKSAVAHPDRFHGEGTPEREAATRRFAELNTAYNCLRDPKLRLLHLLELELSQPPANVQDIPPGTMDLFLEVGQNCRQADALLAGKASQSSPLLRAQWFAKAMTCAETLGALQQRIHSRRDELLGELQNMNAAWTAAPAPGSPERAGALPLRRLEEIGREMSYITRWSGQLHERIAQLSF